MFANIDEGNITDETLLRCRIVKASEECVKHKDGLILVKAGYVRKPQYNQFESDVFVINNEDLIFCGIYEQQ